MHRGVIEVNKLLMLVIHLVKRCGTGYMVCLMFVSCRWYCLAMSCSSDEDLFVETLYSLCRGDTL